MDKEPKEPMEPDDTKKPKARTRFDSIYKNFFGNLPMVESLCRSFMDEELFLGLDFSKAEKVNTNFVKKNDLSQSYSDTVWKILSKSYGEWCYIFLLLEFQRTNDTTMVWRVVSYVIELYQDLQKQGHYKPGQLPWIYPFVIYNGEEPWSAALSVWDLIKEIPQGRGFFDRSLSYSLLDVVHLPEKKLVKDGFVEQLIRLEQCQDLLSLIKIFGKLRTELDKPELERLEQAFNDLLRLVYLKLAPENVTKPKPKIDSLEARGPMILETVAKWPEQWKMEGRQEADQEFEQKIRQIEQEKRQIEQEKRQIEQEKRQEPLNILLTLIAKRFGQESVDGEVKERLRTANPKMLLLWAEKILEAKTVDELFS
jgi:hypothetical protein